jgi:hypothetical protein
LLLFASASGARRSDSVASQSEVRIVHLIKESSSSRGE